jgi:hypothetical protein
MAKILDCGKNKIAEPAPAHGFGMGGTKAEAKHAAIDMAHGFAKLFATAHAAEFKCPREECPKMIGPKSLTRRSRNYSP